MKRRKRRGSTHSDAMRVHAIRRMYERHGIAITNPEFDGMVTAIANGTNAPVAPARGGGTLHIVHIRGRSVFAVWNECEGCIATFLPGGVPLELRFPKLSQVPA